MPLSPSNRLFGQVLARLRREHGLTQERLAEASDLHPNAVSLIERGIQSPTLGTLMRLSSALGLSLTALVGEFEAAEKDGQTQG